MKKSIAWLLVALIVMSVPQMAFAASPWTTKTTYNDKAIGKLQFGLKNLVFGFTEIFMEPKKAVDEHENVPQGFAKGLMYAIGDTIGGALHVVTTPFTQIDVPLPENGVTF